MNLYKMKPRPEIGHFESLLEKKHAVKLAILNLY